MCNIDDLKTLINQWEQMADQCELNGDKHQKNNNHEAAITDLIRQQTFNYCAKYLKQLITK